MTDTYIDLNTSALTWAQRYASRGIRMIALHGLVNGVCTCGKDCKRNGGKHPVKGAWQKTATADYEGIKEQLKGERNLGLVMGAGLVCLDIDGDIGKESLEQLMVEHPDWPAGPVARTGGGGFHFLFRTREDFHNSVKILPGVDVRSKNGQIVAAPSMHRSGQRYTWIGTSWELEIPDLPDWLADLMRGTTTHAFDAKAWVMRQPVSVDGDNGSKVLMSVVAALIRQGRIRSEAAFLAAIAPWNAQCLPPWSEKELTHAFESAFGRYQTEATIDLPTNKNGEVVCDRTALDRILREDARYEFSLQFNEISKVVTFDGAPLTDSATTRIEVEICSRYRIRSIPRTWLEQSLVSAAEDKPFNPVTMYLEVLKWDGRPRWATFAADYLGNPSEASAIYWKRWAIGAVKRAFEPGCKLDTALVLKGAQGVRKSSLLRLLAGGKAPFFSDSPVPFDRPADAALSIQKWIVELSELDSVHRSTAERVKAFLSSESDSFRPPYGRNVIEVPRICVLVGSTNRNTFLNDPTGSRRFWVTDVRKVMDLDKVRLVRDQLWAEAYAAYLAGEPHYLTSDEQGVSDGANVSYTVDDPLYDETCTQISAIEKNPNYSGKIRWVDLCERMQVPPFTGKGKEHDAIIRALRHGGYRPKRTSEARFWEKSTEPADAT